MVIQRSTKKVSSNPIWHPCTQMKDHLTCPPVEVSHAKGSYIYSTNGSRLIDAGSSWWCKLLGHQHPRLKAALIKQLNQFEHVMFANTTNPLIMQLSERLIKLTPNLNKVFYAGDGSCAIEIALKMSLHARKIKGETERTTFIALENGYHGETIGALSVSDLGLYKKPYTPLLFDCYMLKNIPYVNDQTESIWHNCADVWPEIEKQLNLYATTATAIILEPIVQGAGGMKVYSQDLLRRLRVWATRNDVHIIADEIMTGLARTGKMLACDYANIEADFLCLGKNLTAGWLPFSAVLMNDVIYDLFYGDYKNGNSFLHSHTYSGHVLGAALALETLKIIDEEELCEQANYLNQIMLTAMKEIAEKTKKLHQIRSIGGIVAADLKCHAHNKRKGYEVFQQALKKGALMRPLGNTIYWLPPINTSTATIEELAQITEFALLQVSM